MPQEPAKFKPLKFGGLVKIRRKLEDPAPILRSIGAKLLADAQRAFRDQQLGEVSWPARYPSQEEPFINIAGALSDLERGPNVRPANFSRRPALMTTGNLARSLSSASKAVSRPSKFSVEIGTTVPYAPIHQWGGESIQNVSETARKNLAKYSRRQRGAARRGKGIRGVLLAAKNEAIKKLGFLFSVDQLRTNVAQRPFLGVTDQAEDEIRQIIEEDFET